MNLLIAGGAGFIGANFAHLLRQRDHTAIVLDALTYAGNRKNISDLRESRVKLVKGDIRDGALLATLFDQGFRGKKFDAVVNFAAESHVDRAITIAMPFVQSNVLGAVRLLEAARRYEVPTFVQISTDEVYGSIPGTEKATTQSPLHPSNAYAASKAAADLLLRSYFLTHKYDVRITRCTNNYGRFQHPEKFIPTIIRNAVNGQPIPVYGDGHQVRDWVHVDDHAEGIFRVIEGGREGEIYHFGGPNSAGNSSGVENIELVGTILKLLAKKTGKTQKELNKLVQHVQDRPGHDRRYALDWSSTASELSWKPATNLEEGLTRTIDWYLANPNWWD